MKRKVRNIDKRTGKFIRVIRYRLAEDNFLIHEAKRHNMTVTEYIRRKSLNAPLSFVPIFKNVEL